VEPVASTIYSSLHNVTILKMIINISITAKTAKCQKTKGVIDAGMG
jgi:hypothetical protein